MTSPETTLIDEVATIADLLDMRADATPDKVLVNFFEDGIQLSYGALAEQSRSLASSLLTLGVRKTTHVAIMLPNSAEWLIAWFALARLGAVMVPVNPFYRPVELQFVLHDSDAQFLIMDEAAQQTFEAMDTCPPLLSEGTIISSRIDTDKGYLALADLIAAGSSMFTPPVPVTRSDLLAIQYTSGTTGFPKGCLQTHEYWIMVSAIYAQNLANDILNNLVTFPFYYFEPQIQLLFALIRQGTAFAARRHSLTRFMDWLHTYPIDICTTTPQLTNNMPARDDDAQTGLKAIIGYYYKGEEHSAVEKRFGVTVREGFGMTEIGVGTALPAAAVDMVGRGSCGLPAPFREVGIRDENGDPVQSGQAGELWFRGRGMLLGYYKRPAANRNSFVGDWFRTGDLARQDERGYLWIVGRLKEMVKRSGENISAAEVEAAIRQHDAVVEVGVVGVPDPKRKEEVKAYVILAPGYTADIITPDMLAAFAAEHLAAFKIPRYWAYVQDFPRTATNKIAKQRMIEASSDLRMDAYDGVERIWR